MRFILVLILIVAAPAFADVKYVNGNEKTNIITGEKIDELSIVVSYPNKNTPSPTQMPLVEVLGNCSLRDIEPLRIVPMDLFDYNYPFAVHVEVDNSCLIWVKNPYDEKTITIVNYEN